MNNIFYMKLAFINMKKNRRTYVPYLLSCIGTIAMFYMLNAIAENGGLGDVFAGNMLQAFMRLGVGIIGFFAILFLFYTNSFLVKRRKKEFGLFNILGMEKRHIARVLLFETLYTIVLSLGLGIGCGIVLGKGMHLLLLRILKSTVQLGFTIPMIAIKTTVILFTVIFVLSYLNTLRQIHLTKPIDLLKGGSQGEKEPKAKWLMALVGLICLLIGYAMAATAKNPLEVIGKLFLAIILVIIGTYCLFIAGSIVVLKILRKNKKYYYKAKHFTTISGMIYRMKQNAAGLANICILSTGVLLSVSTTFSLYAGVEDAMGTRYPREIGVRSMGVSKEKTEDLDQIIEETIQEQSVEVTNQISCQYMELTAMEQENGFLLGNEMESMGTIDDICVVVIVPLEEYNKNTNGSETLEKDEILFGKLRGTEYKKEEIQIGDTTFKIKRNLEDTQAEGEITALMSKSYLAVVPDYETAVSLRKKYEGADTLRWYYGFDLEEDGEKKIEFEEILSKKLDKENLNGYTESRERNRKDVYALYGSIFFLGIFLGILFLMATVLIIYYKQVSEGYEDRERFIIMQKVGMSHKEVKRSIHSQILLVFFLPLVTAVIHIIAAYPILERLLAMLHLSNDSIFMMVLAITVLLFALLYGWIYAITARTYYKIVSQK